VQELPIYVSSIFFLCTLYILAVLFWICKSSPHRHISKKAIGLMFFFFVWLKFQARMSTNGTYSNFPDAIPPKIFLLGILPAVIIVIILFTSSSTKSFIETIPLQQLHALHIVRVPVELGLWALFAQGMIPQVMTFEGWNFDIIIGLTTPLILYLGFYRKTLSNKFLLAWNISGLLLLAIIFVTAFLSAPSPLQKLAFDQPNIAMLHFPYSWLPTFIVPIVAWAHIASIQRLMRS